MNAVASPSLSSDSGSPEVPDVIDSLVGIAPGQHLDRIRRGREQARTHAQQSYISLFAPKPPVPGNFDTYRSLRINEMPEVVVTVVKSNEKPTGVGEPGVPPIGPAVANAMAKLGRVRPRQLPIVGGAST